MTEVNPVNCENCKEPISFRYGKRRPNGKAPWHPWAILTKSVDYAGANVWSAAYESLEGRKQDRVLDYSGDDFEGARFEAGEALSIERKYIKVG